MEIKIKTVQKYDVKFQVIRHIASSSDEFRSIVYTMGLDTLEEAFEALLEAKRNDNGGWRWRVEAYVVGSV